MPYKCWEAKFSEVSNQKYHKSDEEHNDESSSRNTEVTKGARGLVHARGLRRSKHIVDRSHKTYAKEDEEEEEVLNFSHQSTTTILQLSSTQQLSSQQSAYHQ
ncbi:hypothetical protein C1645_823985 [Glomus cerebriforme]|uniref:Uncharacterized protein n=1 Tax=Glomus cerebriforme TaxID=658196 RepID=A0A397T4E4_9GLOM|nr:hypothetical protein C1645_823985 [Glomus cerebriforme]